MSFYLSIILLSVATPAKTSPPPTSEMTIFLSMEQPEIILIEDQMDPSSNSLLLSVSCYLSSV